MIANQAEVAQIGLTSAVLDKSKPRQKSHSPNRLKRAFLHLTNKAKDATQRASNTYQNYSEDKNLKNVLKGIKKCWIKYPNNYEKRDRSVIYRPFIWEQYDIALE